MFDIQTEYFWKYVVTGSGIPPLVRLLVFKDSLYDTCFYRTRFPRFPHDTCEIIHVFISLESGVLEGVLLAKLAHLNNLLITVINHQLVVKKVFLTHGKIVANCIDYNKTTTTTNQSEKSQNKYIKL